MILYGQSIIFLSQYIIIQNTANKETKLKHAACEKKIHNESGISDY